MKHNKRGFTLIELLVVVLIIGILSAIALPQYKTTVMKSRFTSFFPLMRSIKDAQERYYMVNGHYAVSFKDLDIQLPSFCEQTTGSPNFNACGKEWFIDNAVGNNKAQGSLGLSYCPDYNRGGYTSCHNNSIVIITINYDQKPSNPGQKSCTVGKKGGEFGEKLCKLFIGWTH